MADLSDDLLSLQDATKYCNYSQEYLGLRARQGKLQAIKIGRNWATTRQWLQDYIAKANDYKNNHYNNSHSQVIDPPTNLPVYAPEADTWEGPTVAESVRRWWFWQKAQFATAIALVCMLGIFSVVREHEAVYAVADEFYDSATTMSVRAEARITQLGFAMGVGIEAQRQYVAQNSFMASISEVMQEYVAWLGNQARAIAMWLGIENEEKQEEKGLVVLPASENNEQVIEQIQQSFSDEVRVVPHDASSGIITPVFRDRTGEDYLYILVPIQENF